MSEESERTPTRAGGKETEPSPFGAHERARELLRRALASETTHEELAAAMLTSPKVVEDYHSRRRHIPLERQLLLAAFVVDRGGPLRPLGHRLRAQIRAALAYAVKETETHDNSPPRRFW